MSHSTHAPFHPIDAHIESASQIFQFLRSRIVALGCGTALLAACSPFAWGAVIEPDHPNSVPGMGNGGHLVDPGIREAPRRPMPMCVTAGCTVIAGPELPSDANDQHGDGASANLDGGGARSHGCPSGDTTGCKLL